MSSMNLVKPSIPITTAFRGFLSRYMKTQTQFKFDIDREKAKSFLKTLYIHLQNKSRIALWGDYDVDGMGTTAFMVDFINDFANVLTLPTPEIDFTIPSREEHYGIKYEKFRQLSATKDLVITIDNGVHKEFFSQLTDKDREKLWIIDHHPLSQADSKEANTINPNIGGAVKISTGLVVDYIFQLARLSFAEYGKQREQNHFKDLVAITLISDMADRNNPMVRANIKEGLKVVEKRERAIYRHLFPVFNGQKEKGVTVEDIAFKLNPYLNSGPRLGVNGNFYVELLLNKNGGKIFDEYARRGTYINTLRKDASNMYSKQAQEIVEKEKKAVHNLRMVYIKECPIGLNGLIAGNIFQKHAKDVIVVSRNVNGDNRIVGSGRGEAIKKHIEKLVEMFPEAKELIEFGGHDAAVGVKIKNMTAFKKVLDTFNEKSVDLGVKKSTHKLFNKNALPIEAYKMLCTEYHKITSEIPLNTNIYVKVKATIMGITPYRNNFMKLNVLDEEGESLTLVTKESRGIDYNSMDAQELCLCIQPKNEKGTDGTIFTEILSSNELRTDEELVVSAPSEFLSLEKGVTLQK